MKTRPSVERRHVNPATKREAMALAARVLALQGGCEVQSIAYLGGGSFGFVFKATVDRAPFTRIMKACRTDGMANSEAAALRLLRETGTVRVPEVYFTFAATNDIPLDFICMEAVPGRDCFTNLGAHFHTRKTKQRFADAVTAAMYVWHSRTNERFGLLEAPAFEDWLGFYRPFAEDVLNAARRLTAEGALQKRVLRVMERAWAQFDLIFSEPVPAASLIHGDMNPMNILADRRLRLTAVIDPLESKWADPEYDLFQLRNLGGDRFRLYETYKQHYPTSKNCDLKTAFYALFHEVYVFVISGFKSNFILNPLVRRMTKALDRAGL